jgi:Mg-chelatase subunit ChlD
MAIAFLFIPRTAQASEFGDAGLDVVVVIDTSGSMKQTDPDRIAVEAAKLFIDMTEMSGSKLSVVSFSDELGTVTELLDISSVTDKENLKSRINKLPYKGDTDMGLALQKGYEILQSQADDGNKKAILFLTDGKIDLGKSKTRTDEDSYNDTQEIVKKAAADGVPIYTIGLNSDGNVDQNLLSDIAENTSGRSYLVDSSDNLPRIFDEIFADFINSNIIPLGDFVTNGSDFTEIPFNISNNSVLEANIILLSQNKLKEIELINPNGETVVLNTDDVIVSESSQYTLLKLITPVMGDWMLRIRGSEGCKVHVNLIFNYKVNLACEVKLVSDASGTYIQATSWLEKEDEKLTDEALYAAFTGEAFCKGSSGETSYPMKNEGGFFEAEIPVGTETGDFYVYTRIDSDSMYRVSETLTVSVTNNGPVFTNLPEEVNLKGIIGSLMKEKINLSDYTSDPEGDELTYAAEVDPAGKGIASVAVKDGVLHIKGGKSGTTNVKITATDKHGASQTATIKVVDKSTFPNILPILLILVLLIILIVVLLRVKMILKEKNQIFFGNLRWLIATNKSREQVYPLGYERGTIPLSKIIMDPSLSEMSLDKITLRMNKRLDGIIVSNKSKHCEIIAGFGGTPQTKVDILNGEFAMLNGKCAGNEVSIKVTFSLY